MYCMLCYRCYVTYVSRGTSGRIVIEVEPELKKQVYAVLALSGDRKSTRLNSSHLVKSYAVFCLKKKSSHPQRRYGRPGLAVAPVLAHGPGRRLDHPAACSTAVRSTHSRDHWLSAAATTCRWSTT